MLERAKKEANIQREENKNQKTKTSKQNQGITLIALVVTIVVLLILAGVSIIVIFGDNGMIKTAKNSTLQTKLAEIEERANIAYADLNSKKYQEGNSTKKITMQDVADELNGLKNEKYKVETQTLTGSAIEGIKLDQANIKLEKGKTANLEATFIYNESGVAHYVKVEEKYYEISLENNHINLDKTNGKDKIEGSQEEEKGTITATISDNDVATVVTTQTEKGATIQITPGTTIGKEATITVSYGNLTPATCTVIMKLAPTSDASKPNGNQSPIQNGYGKIDIIWLDENNNIIAEPKAPILQSKTNPTAEEKVKMTPVKWSGTGATATLVDTGVEETNPEITKADGTKEKDWYDYENHRWANARTNNQSYFVWIPRYAYRITYYASKGSTTPVGYCDGYGMWRPDGTLEYKLDDGIETVEAQDGNLYIVHPAFGSSNQKLDETNEQYATRKTQNINNGGWGDTLTGFWFAKFEMSGEDGATLKSSPEGNSKRSTTIGEFYTMGRTATYGQTGSIDSTATDGITLASFMNSHMVKNSEWGAVAYLTHSKFGLNGEEVAINGPSDNGTGGGTSATAYLSNQNQSTTANPYGVYDMSGGAYEYTAAFNNTDSNSYFGNTSKWTTNTKLTTSSNSTKYATKYENSTGNVSGNTIYTVCKTGDATKEVYLGNNGSSGWYSDSSHFASSGHPFFGRGGYYSNGTSAGVFCSTYYNGYSGSNISFRAALAPFSL